MNRNEFMKNIVSSVYTDCVFIDCIKSLSQYSYSNCNIIADNTRTSFNLLIGNQYSENTLLVIREYVNDNSKRVYEWQLRIPKISIDSLNDYIITFTEFIKSYKNLQYSKFTEYDNTFSKVIQDIVNLPYKFNNNTFKQGE